MVAIAEALALLTLGLVFGILSALYDVIVVGAGAFVAHFSLWVLLNVLIAIHVDSRLKAIWWAIPFNMGYIECYYICTAASLQGYAKSLVVPLAAMTVASPMLTYAIWTAKRDRGPYGKILSILIAAGVVGAGYYILGTYDIFTIVVSVILLAVLLFWPARRLKFTRAVHPPTNFEEEEEVPSPRSRSRSKEGDLRNIPTPRRDNPYDEYAYEYEYDEHEYDYEQDYEYEQNYDYEYEEEVPEIPDRRETSRSGRRRSQDRRRSGYVRGQQARNRESDRSSEERERTRRRPTRRSTRRSASEVTPRGTNTRRSVRERDERNREAQRRTAAQRRARRIREDRRGATNDNGYYMSGVSTLGTSRAARPSSRSGRSRYA